jgi:hypothetical protein
MKKLVGMLNFKERYMKPGCTIGIHGKDYNFLEFDIDKYDAGLPEMVVSLAKINRYVGNTRGAYSVAQHSVMGARALLLIGEIDAAKQFLFHDVGETIYGDFSGPIKRLMEKALDGHEWFDLKKLMDEVDRQICEKYGAKWPHDDIVHVVDKNLASYELTNTMTYNNHCDYWDEDKSVREWWCMWKTIRTHELIASGVNNDYEVEKAINDELARLGYDY